MSLQWIKLYCEILDDPKMGRLPEWLFARFIKLLLLAGREGKDGMLPPVEDMLWTLHLPNDAESFGESLQTLAGVGVVHQDNDGHWWVVNYKPINPNLSLREIWNKLRRKVATRIYERDGGKCKYCGAETDLQIDHIIPIARGGSNDLDNLQILCRACNQRKGARL